MNLGYEYYEQTLGRETASVLRGKIKLSISRMPRYDWYAAGMAISAMPSHRDLTHTAFLTAAEAMANGSDMSEAITLGLRESTRLASHDMAANTKKPGRRTEDGWTVPMTTSGDTTEGQPIWDDTTRETGYVEVEDHEVTKQLRAVVTAVLQDNPAQCEAVMLYLFSDDADTYGWHTSKARELGISKALFSKRLRLGLEKVGAAWTNLALS